jgi:hypothetical protein
MANVKSTPGAVARTQDLVGALQGATFANTASDAASGLGLSFRVAGHALATSVYFGAQPQYAYFLIDQPLRLTGAAITVINVTGGTVPACELEVGLASDLDLFVTGVAFPTVGGVVKTLSGTSTADFGGGTTVSAGDILAVNLVGGSTTNAVLAAIVYAVPRTG